MMQKQTINVRPATLHDRDFIMGLVPRLTQFGVPNWRDAACMTETDRQILSGKLTHPPEGTALFIAEDATQQPMGFIHLQTGQDYYNKEKHGHISDIIIIPEKEGNGIGRLLMDKAEQWARECGYRWLTLSVFAQHARAREMYAHLGFGEDILKYVKVIA